MKKMLSLVLALCMVFALCSISASAAEDITFTTGGEAGTYYAYGGVLASYVNNNAEDMDITVVSSGGSQANIEDINEDFAQLGFSQSDVMSYAYAGSRTFEEIGAIDSFSAVACLYMEQVQIVTMDPDIKTGADLKGKTVSVGASGSGTYFNAIDCLGAYGLTEEDINPVYQNFADSAESLKDHKIDAAFIVAGAPTTAIVDLATTGDVYIVAIEDDVADKLIESSPYYSKYTIPAGTYGMENEVNTVAIAAVVLARDTVSEDTVYKFVSTIFDNADAITELHGKGAELDLEFASSITDVPYHAGAAKYFAEQGIEVAVK